jgi:hypothetical protein
MLPPEEHAIANIFERDARDPLLPQDADTPSKKSSNLCD